MAYESPMRTPEERLKSYRREYQKLLSRPDTDGLKQQRLDTIGEAIQHTLRIRDGIVTSEGHIRPRN